MAIAPIEPPFTARSVTAGGRDGESRAEDGTVAMTLSVPRETGGPGIPIGAPRNVVEQARAVVCPCSHATRDEGAVAFDVRGA